MDKIKHVQLGYSRHFLVVNGTRGAIADGDDRPAMHPSGYGRFLEEAYSLPENLKGKLFRFVTDVTAEFERIPQCVEADKAYNQYSEIVRECESLKVGEYSKDPALLAAEAEEQY